MVGDKLRAEREKQNLTVKDIEKGTSIRALYIECIEKGDYEQLPGEVYTKGFIRNYANYLKLNATELVHEFVAERHPEKAAAAPVAQAAKVKVAPAAPQKEQASKARETAAAAAQPAAAEEKKAPAETKAAPAPAAAPRKAPQRPAAPARQEHKARKAAPVQRSFSAPSSDSNRGKFIILAVVLVVVVGVAAYLLGSSSSETPAPASQQAQQQQAAEPQKTYDGVEVTGKFSDDCWIEVKADGKVVYEGTLKKGDSMDWKGQENVTVRAGNAGAVEFTVNGKELGKAGKEGQVANKTFTKDAN